MQGKAILKYTNVNQSKIAALDGVQLYFSKSFWPRTKTVNTATQTLKVMLYTSIHNYLTFRLLMSYIYMEHPFLMFLGHTQRRSTVGRTPLDG